MFSGIKINFHFLGTPAPAFQPMGVGVQGGFQQPMGGRNDFNPQQQWAAPANGYGNFKLMRI
jgi:hypothetical protein